MTETVILPDVVALVIGHLNDTLPARGYTADALPRIPTERPAQFVLVRRVGGVRRSIVSDAATLTIEAWAANDETAHDIAQQCRALIRDMRGTVVDGVPVYSVQEVAGPALLPDPESDAPRYTQTVEVHARGAAPTGS